MAIETGSPSNKSLPRAPRASGPDGWIEGRVTTANRQDRGTLPFTRESPWASMREQPSGQRETRGICRQAGSWYAWMRAASQGFPGVHGQGRIEALAATR